MDGFVGRIDGAVGQVRVTATGKIAVQLDGRRGAREREGDGVGTCVDDDEDAAAGQ